MPVFIRHKGWKFYIYIGDSTLRPHIHIRKDGSELAVWLDDVSVKTNKRVKSKDERDLVRVVADNQMELMEAWNELFGD